MKKHFADDTEVFLFCSRVNDELKGGDVDLFVRADAATYRLENKIRFLADLEKAIGERKIDVVFDNERVRKQTAFYDSIQRTMQYLKL